jgi:hypothetical protein
VLFQCFVAPEGRKVRWLQRPVRSHLAERGQKLQWREAHVQVKISKYTMRQKLTVFDHFGTFTCCLMWQVQGVL